MNEPTFDADGYPTDETLVRIRTWPFEKFSDLEDLMDFAGRAWSYGAWEKERGYVEPPFTNPCVRYVFSTNGWSGNEFVVAAMEENGMLALVGPWSWRRGGHYEYRLPQGNSAVVATRG